MSCRVRQVDRVAASSQTGMVLVLILLKMLLCGCVLLVLRDVGTIAYWSRLQVVVQRISDKRGVLTVITINHCRAWKVR